MRKLHKDFIHTGSMKKLSIFIDGASSGNPGPAGIGVLITEHGGDTKIKEVSSYIGEATNNVAEYNALIYGLNEALELNASEVLINTDSELLANQLTGGFKVKNSNLKYLLNEAKSLLERFRKVEIRCVPREENKAADKLASAAIKSVKKIRQGETKVIKN